MDKKFPWPSKLGSKLTVFWVHKDMSQSYREGIDQKLKTMAFPYKTKVRKKKDQNFDFGVLKFHKDLSKSIREGIDQKLKTMAFPYKIKG